MDLWIIMLLAATIHAGNSSRVLNLETCISTVIPIATREYIELNASGNEPTADVCEFRFSTDSGNVFQLSFNSGARISTWVYINIYTGDGRLVERYGCGSYPLPQLSRTVLTISDSVSISLEYEYNQRLARWLNTSSISNFVLTVAAIPESCIRTRATTASAAADGRGNSSRVFALETCISTVISITTGDSIQLNASGNEPTDNVCEFRFSTDSSNVFELRFNVGARISTWAYITIFTGNGRLVEQYGAGSSLPYGLPSYLHLPQQYSKVLTIRDSVSISVKYETRHWLGIDPCDYPTSKFVLTVAAIPEPGVRTTSGAFPALAPVTQGGADGKGRTWSRSRNWVGYVVGAPIGTAIICAIGIVASIMVKRRQRIKAQQEQAVASPDQLRISTITARRKPHGTCQLQTNSLNPPSYTSLYQERREPVQQIAPASDSAQERRSFQMSACANQERPLPPPPHYTTIDFNALSPGALSPPSYYEAVAAQ